MKLREPRLSVCIGARVRHGDKWSDANILNLSSRGLLVRAPTPPSRGTYIEIRRGAHVVVGRVVWTTTDRFGVRAQDKLAIESLISTEMLSSPAAQDGERVGERRARPRTAELQWRNAKSRHLARAFEFACFIGLGLLLGGLAYDTVTSTLSTPLSQISTQLGRHGNAGAQ